MAFNGYSYNTITGIIDLLYTGRVKVTGKEVNDLKQAINFFKISGIRVMISNEPAIPHRTSVDIKHLYNLSPAISVSRVTTPNGPPKPVNRSNPLAAMNPPPMTLQQKAMLAERNVLKRNCDLPQTKPINEMIASGTLKRTRVNQPPLIAKPPLVNSYSGQNVLKISEKPVPNQLLKAPSAAQPSQFVPRPVQKIPSSTVMTVSGAKPVDQVAHKSDVNVQRGLTTPTKNTVVSNINGNRPSGIHVSNASPKATKPIQSQLQENKENNDTENENITFEFIDNSTSTITNENAIKHETDANNNPVEDYEDDNTIEFDFPEFGKNTNAENAQIDMDIEAIGEKNEDNENVHNGEEENEDLLPASE